MQLYAADGKSLGYTDDQPGLDHMKMILRLQDAKAIPTLAEEAEVATKGPEAQFSVTKKAAIDWLAGSNMLVAMWTAAGADRNYMVMPIPRAKGKKQGTSIRPSQFQAVTAQSKHPKEAAMFLDFFINDVEANKVLNAERGVPINSVVLKALAATAGPAQKAIYDYLDRLSQDSYPLYPLDPVGAENVRTQVYYPLFTDPVRYGKITPEEGVAVFRQKANETLAAGK
jgi:multiple sugar transport system substrate-binding protein